MAKPKRPGGPKQKLSPAAAKRKAARDLKIAKTPRRTAMKAETQRKRRVAKRNGVSVKGKDWDHNRGKFVSEKVNRSATKTTNNTLNNKTMATRKPAKTVSAIKKKGVMKTKAGKITASKPSMKKKSTSKKAKRHEANRAAIAANKSAMKGGVKKALKGAKKTKVSGKKVAKRGLLRGAAKLVGKSLLKKKK